MSDGRVYGIIKETTMTIALWVVQILLALAFGMAGIMKSSQPIEKLKKNMSWVGHMAPGVVRLIGVLEFLGALGLILPAATNILPWLTPVAAAGLVITMIGAIVVHVRLKEAKVVMAPLILLLLALFIVFGRFILAPIA